MARSAWRLPGYRVEELLGSGASGEVWRARVNATGRGVALKRIWLSDAAQRRAALSEAAMLKALDHPHLMKLHEVCHVGDDAIVLVLDLAAAGSLASLLARRGRLTVGEVITAVAPIGAALAYAQHSGIVHGDVSAANVLFTDIGLPLLADLGVARLLGSALPVRTTPAYVDPLVAGGSLPTPASDVFMLGGVALHALTGAPPWPGNVPIEVLEEAAYGEPPDFAAQLADAGVPERVAAPVLRALDMEPARRGTAADFALDLRHAATPVAVELTAGRARIAPTLRAPASGPVGSWPLASVRVGESVRVGGPASGSRPVAGRPVAAEEPEVPFVGEPPLTYGVRAPSPFAPVPGGRHSVRSRHRLATALAVAAMALAVVVTAAMWWWPDRHPGAAQSRGAAAAGAVAASEGSAGSGSAGSGSAGSGSAGSAGSAGSGSAGSGSAGSAGSAGSGSAGVSGAPSAKQGAPSPVSTPPPSRISPAQTAAVLRALDTTRAAAFARRDPAALTGVYASARLLARDRALLTTIVPAGCGLQGVRTRFGDLRIITRAPTLLRVHVRAAVEASSLVCAGTPSGRAAAAPPVVLQIDLVRQGSGYLIAAEHRG